MLTNKQETQRYRPGKLIQMTLLQLHRNKRTRNNLQQRKKGKSKTSNKENLAKTLDKHNTHALIKECTLIGIERAFTEKTKPIQDSELSFEITPQILRALNEQQEIGWANFYRGRLSQAWLIAQETHNTTTNNQKKQDTEQWASKIITTTWHGFLQL